METDNEFHMGITPYYAALMDPDDPRCPVRLQSVPTMGETIVAAADLEDPLAEERDMPVPGITHRYPDRVLFYITHNCPVYCRHCTRKRKVADPTSAAAKKQIEDGLDYIALHPEIRDVVISGGDPLSLSDDRLDYILGRLRAIPHVEIFRLGTRNLVTLPQRVTDDFVHMLRKHQPVYVNTHFNHPKECTAEAFEAARRLADAGCVIGNQMVLLKGVNDDPKTVMELNHKLLLMRVRPYYIYQCDLAKGISHFRTTVEAGRKIIRSLRGHTSGLAVPHFVVDAPERRREDPGEPRLRGPPRGEEVGLPELPGQGLHLLRAVTGRARPTRPTVTTATIREGVSPSPRKRWGRRGVEVGAVAGLEHAALPVVGELDRALQDEDELLAVVGQRPRVGDRRVEGEQEGLHVVPGRARDGSGTGRCSPARCRPARARGAPRWRGSPSAPRRRSRRRAAGRPPSSRARGRA